MFLKPAKTRSSEGVYFLRTNLQEKDEKTMWNIYNTIREIEATFRTLKSDLSLRPIFVSCQNARVNSTKNRVMKNQKTLSCSFNLNPT